jgi:hypothetical protein
MGTKHGIGSAAYVALVVDGLQDAVVHLGREGGEELGALLLQPKRRHVQLRLLCTRKSMAAAQHGMADAAARAQDTDGACVSTCVVRAADEQRTAHVDASMDRARIGVKTARTCASRVRACRRSVSISPSSICHA